MTLIAQLKMKKTILIEKSQWWPFSKCSKKPNENFCEHKMTEMEIIRNCYLQEYIVNYTLNLLTFHHVKERHWSTNQKKQMHHGRIEYKVVYTYDTIAQNRLERPEWGRTGQPGTVRGGTDCGSTERLRLLTLKSRVWKPYKFSTCVQRSDLYHHDINTCKLWFIFVTDPV